MSGPIIMLRRKLSRTVARSADAAPADAVANALAPRAAPAASRPGNPVAEASGTTWAERAWMLIGAYWIVLGLVVIPARLHEFKLGDVILFGLAPIVVAIGLRVLGPATAQGPEAVRAWTHAAAIGLLATWPLAWVCLIILGESLR
jgi:hypothetical protein